MDDLPDIREQVELLLVRGLRAVFPKTFEAAILRLPKMSVNRDQVLGLARAIEGMDDAHLRFFLLERATLEEAAMIRQAVGVAVLFVRTNEMDSEGFLGISVRMLRGEPLAEICRLGLVGMAGPDDDPHNTPASR